MSPPDDDGGLFDQESARAEQAEDVPELQLPERPRRPEPAQEPEADGPRDWDADRYDIVADPQEEWGKEVLERLELSGDETVLDAGCGSGRVTKLLVERLPEGRVIGVDGSPSMIERARQNLGDKVELIVSDLLDLSLPEPVDAIFSNATFHWIADHDRLFVLLHGLLRPKGQLVAQCGGAGNIATLRASVSQVVREPLFSEHFAGWETPWNFATVPETKTRLERAGFAQVDCWEERRVVRPKRPRDYLAVGSLGAHLDRLPPELHERFVSEVAHHLPGGASWMSTRIDPEARRGGPELDYVRLNIAGRREK